MKKRFVTLILALILACSLTIPVGASALEQEQGDMHLSDLMIAQTNMTFDNESLEGMGRISTKDAVVINGVVNYLYPTFDDVDFALATMESTIPEYLSLVEEKINLAEAYEYDYAELMETDFQVDITQAVAAEVGVSGVQMNVASQNDSQVQERIEIMTKNLETQKQVFDLFFDIYENKAQNEAIKAYLESTSNPDPEMLAYMLPYNAPFSVEYFENAAPAAAAAQTFNVTNGTAYAVKWAEARNYPAYPSYNGDCANFASQILIAGGIKMHESSSTDSGWWCRTVGTVNPGTSHVTSKSWRLANNFVRFMGTSGNEYTSFYTFSTKVRAGDFIAYDGTRDGSWDHVGFITATGDAGTYNYRDSNNVVRSKYYRTFCVAQHNTDYYAWVHSAQNNWEVLDGKATFAIVRRNAVA